MQNILHFPARVAVTIAALTILFTVAAPPAGAASGFGDVDDDTFFTEAVAWLVTEDITVGVEPGCFGPNEAVSRGQIATFLFRLDRALGHEPQAAPHPFGDLVQSYQQEPVGWLYDAGVTTGTSATTFSPDLAISRGDFATMLWRYAGEPTGSRRHPFTDVTRSYQQAAISWLAAEEISTGTTPSTFSPTRTVTRAEAAAFIWRFAAPDGAVEAPEETNCLRALRSTLVAGGLTSAEAACAAPFLGDFETHYLESVVSGEVPADLSLLVAVVEVVNAGCISPARLPVLVKLLI